MHLLHSQESTETHLEKYNLYMKTARAYRPGHPHIQKKCECVVVVIWCTITIENFASITPVSGLPPRTGSEDRICGTGYAGHLLPVGPVSAIRTPKAVGSIARCTFQLVIACTSNRCPTPTVKIKPRILCIHNNTHVLIYSSLCFLKVQAYG